MDVTSFGCPKECHKKCESMYPIVRLSQTEALFSLAQQSSTFADGKHFENIQMNPECSQWFQQAFDSLFSRWTALKLAVEHSNDTRKGLQVNKMQCDHINKIWPTITCYHSIHIFCRQPSKLRAGSLIIAHKTKMSTRVRYVTIWKRLWTKNSMQFAKTIPSTVSE